MTLVVATLLLITVLGGASRASRAGTLADRIIAVDVALMGTVGAFALLAVERDQPWALDVLPVLGLLAIVGTLAVARAVGGRR